MLEQLREFQEVTGSTEQETLLFYQLLEEYIEVRETVDPEAVVTERVGEA
ncbi:MAG: hypothetical protein ACYS0H_28350 [Planctomycetota bacterium]|jgi:hypothetical protein